MATVIKWLEIIMKIIELIVDGMSKEDAVKYASRKFGVSEREIWKHGGF